MAQIIQSPSPLRAGFSVFLGGSIEMGKALNWQTQIEKELAGLEILIFNPRRDEWDPSWGPDGNDPHFREQVEWELSALEKANIIVLYFDPATHAPISLLELGLFGRTGKMIVCCPAGFWRKGNVDIVCQRYAIQQVDSLDELVSAVIARATAYRP